MKRIIDYPGYQALLAEAANQKIDPRRVRLLLWLIQACPTLTDLPTVLANLRRILIVADRNWPNILAQTQLQFLLPLIGQLLKLLKAFQIPTPPSNEKGQHDWLTDDGNLDRNPFYFALRALPAGNTPHVYRCCLLLAHVFFAQLIVLRRPNLPEEESRSHRSKPRKVLPRRNSSLPAYETYDFEAPWPELRVPCRHAGLAIRYFAAGAPPARQLVRHFALSLPPRSFADALPKEVVCADLKSKRKQEDPLSYIYNFVRQGQGLKPRHLGHGRKAHSHCTDENGSTIPASPTEPRTPAGSVQDQNSVQSNEEGLQSGSDTGDNASDQHDRGAGKTDKEKEGSEQKQSGNNRRNQEDAKKDGRRRGDEGGDRSGGDPTGSLRTQAIRSSKAFQFDIDRLAPCELVPIEVEARKQAHCLMDSLLAGRDSSAPNLSADASARIDEAELYIFILVQLWTNNTVRKTKAISISTNMGFKEELPLAVLMSRDGGGKDAIIRVRARWPKECDAFEAQIRFDRERTQYPMLPDEAELGTLLWKLDVLQGSFNSQMQRLEIFRKPIAHYKAGITQLLMKWDETGRLTPSRLCHALYWATMSWSGKDIVAATMITGDYKEQARVPMFYPCRRMDILQATYAQTVRDLRHRIRQEALFASNPEAKRTPIDNLLLHTRRSTLHSQFHPAEAGSLYVGTKPCPTDGDMQGIVQNLLDRLSARWDIWETKQRIEYTKLYTFYCVWGYFGFWTGCREICDPYLPLSALSPNDRSALLDDKREEKARIIWVGEDLFTQMGYYEEFLKVTGLNYADQHPCWFLDADGKPLQVRPGTLKPVLHEFLPGFRLNTNRRYMTNALWDSGCPPEIVRLWSGHATAGNALWSSGATAPYAEMRITLHRHLGPVMDYLGFRSIPGATT